MRGYQMSIFSFMSPLISPWKYSRAQRLELREGLSVPIVSLEALLTMKREAGRPQDLADIDALLELADHGR